MASCSIEASSHPETYSTSTTATDDSLQSDSTGLHNDMDTLASDMDSDTGNYSYILSDLSLWTPPPLPPHPAYCLLLNPLLVGHS